MSPTLEVMEIKLRRGWTIRILYLHSEPTNDKLLQKALASAGHHVSMATVHGDLQYLEEKGYVALEKPDLEIEGLDFEMMIARLTAKGKDLRLGIVTDPGIDIGPRS